MGGWGKIAVCARSASGGDPLFLVSWTRLITKGLRRADVALDPVVELPHHYAANCVTDHFLNETKCDSLLWLDDDMIFDKDLLEKLRTDSRTFKYDICGAMYISGCPPHLPLVIVDDPESVKGTSFVAKPPENTVMDVAVVGLGFTLMRREMLASMRHNKPKGTILFHWGLNGDSEDACFCQDAIKAGYKIGCHTGLVAHHRRKLALSWNGQGLEIKMRNVGPQ